MSVKKSGNYYGLCRVRSVSLVYGYRPRPISFSVSRKRCFIFLNADHSEISKFLYRSRCLLNCGLDIYIVTEDHETSAHVEMMLAKLGVRASVYSYFVENVDGVLDKLFSGVHDTYESIGYTASPDSVTSSFIGLSGTVFLDMRHCKLLSALNHVSFLESKSSFLSSIAMSASNTLRKFNIAPSKYPECCDKLVIVEFCSQTKEVLWQMFLRGDVKSLLFCTSAYAQFLKSKCSVE